MEVKVQLGDTLVPLGRTGGNSDIEILAEAVQARASRPKQVAGLRCEGDAS
nr:hypothetical protein [Candidatus Njordarchaeota archaeon]